MGAESAKATLRDCTNGLLRNRKLPQKTWTKPLEQLFMSIIGGEDVLAKTHRYTAGGCALAPSDAGNCLNQGVRTQKFLRGLYAAIREAQGRFPAQTIRVLYAGSGPFGTLVVPLTTQFEPHEVQFTALEIHENSAACLRKIIQALEIGGYFADVVQADATKYHPRNTPHIIVTEAMDRGLLEEPQAAITANLAQHLPDDGIFIPEEVLVSAFLSPADNEKDELDFGRKDLGQVVSLTKEINARANGASCLDIDCEFDIPNLFVGHSLCLDTRVRIFDNEVLEPDESNITKPKDIGTVKAACRGKKLRLRYRMGRPEEYVTMSIRGEPNGRETVITKAMEVSRRLVHRLVLR